MSSINLLGSALDVESIVQGLMQIEAAPIRRMESDTKFLQSKLSAFQSLNTKLSALSEKVEKILYGGDTAPLLTPYSFSERLSESIFSLCTATSSNEDLISADVKDGSSPGSYAISVSNLASAQSSASANFDDMTTVNTGTGTITFTTGINDPVNITIDATNNTLSGVRNAINTANAGVTATIINDGAESPYRLLITSNESGTENSFTITDNLSGGLSLGLAEVQAAEDAQLVVNGLAISKSSNTITDVIEGVALSLKSVTASDVRINLERDNDGIIETVKELIAAYNEVESFINSQFTYNAATERAGILAGDPTLRSIQNNLHKYIIQGVDNQYTSYSVIGQIGIEFNRDGSLTLDETEFREALEDNFTDVAALLLGDGTPEGSATVSDNRLSYAGRTGATQPGTYAVEITSLAEQAVSTGTQTITNITSDETLTIMSGTDTAIVNLLSGDDLVTVLSKINSALSTEGMNVTAEDDGTGQIRIFTNNYGSSYDISIVSDLIAGAGTTGFGNNPVMNSGRDIEGTIGGNSAVGSGLNLTGSVGQPEEGLSLNILQTVTGSYGTVTVAPESEGVEGPNILTNLQKVLEGITDPLEGPIHHSTDGLNRNISDIKDNIESYQYRLLKREELLYIQFQKADEALRLLSVTQSSLSNQLGNLSTQTV